MAAWLSVGALLQLGTQAKRVMQGNKSNRSCSRFVRNCFWAFSWRMLCRSIMPWLPESARVLFHDYTLGAAH